MTTFYICRHGQTENNRDHRLSGWIDTPLTDEGIHNAESVAAKLAGIHLDQIMSSDLGRAFVTAYIIGQKLGFDGEIVRDKRLREVNYGNLANQPYDAYPDVTPEANTTFTPPGGESLAAMQQRVLERLDELSKAHQDKTILIAAHDGTINAVRASFSGESIGIADKTHNPHDFVAKFTLDGRVVSFEEVR